MNAPGPVILLGGGGLGPWVWDRVTPLLEQSGLTVITPQLRATGSEKASPATVTLSDWIDDLVEELSGHREAILLAHSFAGYVAAGAMKRAAAHLRSVIFLDAVIPRPGASWFESMGPETEQYMRSIARDGATPWFSRPQLDQMYPDNQLTDADLSWMQAHVTAQPIGTFTQPADDQPLETRAKGIRLHYVKCLRTNPPAASISDGAPGWTMSSIDSSHWPMVTAPEDTAKLIVDVAESR